MEELSLLNKKVRFPHPETFCEQILFPVYKESDQK